MLRALSFADGLESSACYKSRAPGKVSNPILKIPNIEKARRKRLPAMQKMHFIASTGSNAGHKNKE
jgi:hypothetical protein